MNLVVVGKMHRVLWAIKGNHRMLAKTFVDELPKPDRVSLMALIATIANEGEDEAINNEHYKPVFDGFFEIKRKRYIRLLAFHAPCHAIVITHGFKKKTDRIDENEKQRTKTIRQEHLMLCNSCNQTDCLIIN